MHGEISKRPFSKDIEKKHYESINMQMGRVQLDSDWNEASETMLKSKARAYTDIIGQHGSPNEGFRVEHDLIVDHLDNKEGWSFTGTGEWRVDHLEKLEGFGSFKITGNGEVKKEIPSLLTNLAKLRQALVDQGATIVNDPRLTLFFKIAATEDAVIELAVEKQDGTDPVSSGAGATYPCNGWLSLDLNLGAADLTEYTSLVLRVESNGYVHFDRLALKPGFATDDAIDDFYIQGGDGTSDQAGRYYVDGLACINEGFETYQYQEDYPEPPAIDLTAGGEKIVYLDVWKRTVTHVEDPDILEVALDGPDTCTREQLISQVKVINASECSNDIDALKRPDPAGTLTAKLSPESEQDKCDFRPELDYTGLRNSLYRIEIHTGGDKDTATFKWSRNNGADLVGIISFESDDKSVIVPDDRVLCQGDWVELGDDVSDLADLAGTGKHGRLTKITNLEHQTDGIKITLENDTGTFTTSPFNARTGRHPKLRKWHGIENVSDFDTFDGSGIPDTELEHGIRLGFSDDYFYHGDYWQFIARTNDRSIEELDQALPMGPEHHYAPLAIVTLDPTDDSNAIFNTCRLMFPALTRLTADHVAFDADACIHMQDKGIDTVQEALEHICQHQSGFDIVVLPGESIQEAIDHLKETNGGSIWLAPGIHMVHKTIKLDQCQDIIIQGDGAATRVVYLPEKSGENSEEIENLKQAIKAKEEEIQAAEEAGNLDLARALRQERRDLFLQYYQAQGHSQAYINICMRKLEIEDEMAELDSGSEEYQALEAELEELCYEYEKLKFEQVPDMFRITESNNITLERFLMFSLKAYSLVSILDQSKAIKIIDCDLINPYWKKDHLSVHIENYPGSIAGHATAKMEMKNLSDKFGWATKRLKKEYTSCARITNGCRIQIEDNRLAGVIGILQQGEYEPTQMPVIDELKCINNRILVEMTGLALLEIQNALIKDNLIYHVGAGVPEEVGEQLEELVEEWLTLDDTCQSKNDELMNALIDLIRDLIFGCTPEDTSTLIKNKGGIFAYAMLNSRIENNRIWAAIGIHLFYSRANKLKNNQVIAAVNALTLLYNFKTRIIGNNLNVIGAVAHIKDFKNGNEDGNNDADKKMKLSKKPGDWGYAINEALGRIPDTDNTVAVRVHFSDQQIFVKNRVQGGIGWMSNAFDDKEYFNILGTYTELWTTPLQGEAAVILIRRFLDAMGLSPTLHLFETLMSIFTGGVDIDWIAFMVEQMTGGSIIFKDRESMRDSTGFMGMSVKFTKNPFVQILVKLFQILINLQIVSRTKLLHNRFDIMQPDFNRIKQTGKPVYTNGIAGIVMLDGITLGGVRISDNRIAGADHTAILWQALAVLNNPELLGSLLHCGYKYLVLMLVWLSDFLQKLIDIFEGLENEEEEDSTSSIFILIATFVLFGIGTICPDLDADAGGDPDNPDAEPENPFLVFLRELVDALNGLIDQLQNGKVEHAVKDLMSNDDRMDANQVRGMGNGIHTNLANTLITANRIDVTPGTSAIAELFAMGRLLATHRLVQADIDPETGAKLDHSSVAYLGYVLMSLNPNMVLSARDMMLDSLEQWNNLEPVLDQIHDIASNSNASPPLDTLIKNIRDNIDDDAQIRTATKAFLDGILNQLTGYGMILEAPGMLVHDNRIEAALECNLDKTKRQPLGGILMTCGSGLQNIIAYFLLIEEAFPLGNIGGQGTEFVGNSLQWGAGHGLSLSNVPLLADLKIENNEIQNFGQMGILCEGPAFASILRNQAKYFRKDEAVALNTFSLQKLLPIISVLLLPFSIIYKIRIAENEINNCLLNQAMGVNNGDDVFIPTLLSGVMVADAIEVAFQENNVRACGNGFKFNLGSNEIERWTGFGTAFIRCGNVTYDLNKIIDNGKKITADQGNQIESYYLRGGALFFGNTGKLSINDNYFSDNNATTLLILPGFTLLQDVAATGSTGFSPVYDTGNILNNVLIVSNMFHIADDTNSNWAKINVGIYNYNSMTIQDLTFSQNQVNLPDIANMELWNGINLAAERLLFNGNMVSGSSSITTVTLGSNKGMGMSNILNHEPALSVNIQMTATTNRW